MKKAQLFVWILLPLLLFSSCSLVHPSTVEPVTLDFLQTGKSDCILIRDRDVTVLVDAADFDDLDTISATLTGYGISTIDAMLLTHYDNDHIGAAAALLERFTVKRIYGPAYEKLSVRYVDLYTTAEDLGVPFERVTEEKALALPDGKLVINPTGLALDENDETDENNQSLILSLELLDARFLLLGDAMKDRLTEYNQMVEQTYDLIKLPHHGDWYKALGELLDKTAPTACVVCTEASSSVEKKLKEKIEDLGATLYGTWKGNVHVSFGQEKQLEITIQS